MTPSLPVPNSNPLDATARTLVERLRCTVLLHWTAGSVLFVLTIALWTIVPVAPGLGGAVVLIADRVRLQRHRSAHVAVVARDARAAGRALLPAKDRPIGLDDFDSSSG